MTEIYVHILNVNRGSVCDYSCYALLLALGKGLCVLLTWIERLAVSH